MERLTHRNEDGKAEVIPHMDEIISRLCDYEDIGSVREFQTLKELDEERGTWQESPVTNNFRCSYCGETFKVDTLLSKPQWEYCPNCGRKMESKT